MNSDVHVIVAYGHCTACGNVTHGKLPQDNEIDTNTMDTRVCNYQQYRFRQTLSMSAFFAEH